MKWLLPSGAKSLSLSTDLRRGPALIAFIDAQPLSIANRMLSVVRIAFDYILLNSVGFAESFTVAVFSDRFNKGTLHKVYLIDITLSLLSGC